MKKTAVTFLCILWTLSVAGCLSAKSEDTSTDEYYELDELLEGFMESIVDADADQFTGLFWPDGVHFVYMEDDEQEYEGQGDISANSEHAWSFIPGDSFEFPALEIFKEEDTQRIHFVYKDLDMRQILYVQRRGELWAVTELVTESYTPHIASDPLKKWADANNNGVFEEAELETYLEAAGTMFTHEHTAEDGFSVAFDADSDGFINRSEIELFRQLSLGVVLPSVFHSEPGYALEMADMNGDGTVSEKEIAMVQQYLASSHPERLPGPDLVAGLKPVIDQDSDGSVSKEEHGDYYYDITERLLLYPFPSNPLETLFAPGLPPGSGTGIFRGNMEHIQGKRIAVLAFENLADPGNNAQTSALTRYVENALVGTNRVTVVDRNDIDKLIEEHRFQAQGLTDENTAIEIGKLAGTQLIATGVFGRVDSTLYLQLRLIDVETGALTASSIAETGELSGLKTLCEEAVRMLF
ncbi:MAG: hypothetical protein JXB03_05845 [Spirochaetales bacterium]|nr:hypothetical protein [Spirochaetales bacterium]